MTGVQTCALPIFAAGIADMFVHGNPFTRGAVALLAAIAVAMVALHFVSIIMSSRLKP